MKRLQYMAGRYMSLMTTSPKLELSENLFKLGVTFQFLLRLHYLIPEDGWHQWNSDDFKVKVPQIMLNVLFQQEGQYIQILLIIFNFTMIAMSFLNIKVCYYYNNALWHFLYIPQMAIFLNLELGNNIAITLLGIFLLLTLAIWNSFFNRATKFRHKSPFVRKFTQLTVLIIFLDTMCIIHFEFHILEILLLHFSSVIRCLEIVLYRPYRTPLNKFVFKFDFLYLTLTPIFTLISFSTDDGLFYAVILYGTLFVALSDPLYVLLIRQQSNDQYMTLHYCQQFYISSEIQKSINQCIHRSHCKQNHGSTADVIICIMEQTVQFNQKYRRQYEILELGLISFFSIHKTTLKAYCRLKKYKNIKEDHSLFFKIGYPAINHQLWKKVRDIQKRLLEELKSKSQTYKKDDLKIKDIFRSNELQDQFFPKLLVVLDQKIDYFKNITMNLTEMSRLLQNTLKLGEQIEGLQKWVNIQIIRKKRKNTIILLKMLEIFYSFIMNDMVSAHIHKKKLIDILQFEGNIQAGKLLNSSIMDNKTILLFTSLVKSKGSIIKFKGNALAQFWGYENEMDFRDIKHINQLMPEFFATVHDEYLDKFLNRGCSDLFDLSRTIFLCDKENLLIPAEIRIDNFTVLDDDYVITAGFSKNKENSLFLLFDSKGSILGVNHLLFKLFKQVDRTITPNDLNYGFVFQIIPKIFHLINIHLNNQKELNVYEETVTLHLCNPISRLFNKFGDCCKLSHNFSQLWVTIEDKSKHPLVEMFNQTYQEQMQSQIDVSAATMNFDLVCTLAFMNIGCFKQLPLFILEITDLNKSEPLNDQTQSPSSHSQRLQSQEIDLSSIQEESFKKVKLEGPEKQLYKEVNLIKGKYDQSYYDLSGFQDSSRQILAPSSQRANFSFIKHKSLEDDSKIIEEDFRYIRQQHDIIQEQVQEEEQSSEKPTKHKNIIGMIQKNRFKEQHEFEQVNSSVNSMNSTEQNNKQELVKQLYLSNNMPTYTKLIGFIDVLIMLCILISNLILIFFLKNNALHALKQIETIQTPHLLNSYYCELYLHALTFQMNKLHILQYSDNLLRDIEQFNQQKYIENMTALYSTFLTLEQQSNFPKINITYIDQPSLENVSFTYLFDQLIDKYQFVCNKLLNYTTFKLSESDLIKSLFLISNLESITKFNQQVVQLITTTFFEDSSFDEKIIINLFLIQSGIEIILLLIQLFCHQNIMNYYKQIMLLNCRIYEQDVHIILEKMYILRRIIIESKNINWKRSDYSGIFFQPLKEGDSIKTHLKVQKTTMLTSRIQNTHLGIMKKVIQIFILLIVLISFNVGGFYFNKSQQSKLTPTQKLSSDFLEFTIQLDSLITQSVRVKTQDIFINFIDLEKVITVSRAKIIPILKSSQGATYFVELFKSLTINQIKMMRSLVEEISVQNQEFYYLFFEDIYDIVCTNSTDSKDNNREYAKNGIMGMYSSLTKYITQSYNYELGSGKSDPDLQNSEILINSDEFITMFIRHFLNTKKAFNIFNGLLLEATKKEVISNNFIVQIYYGFSIAVCLLIFGLSFYISVRQQVHQTKLMRLSLTTIPIELIDQQSVSILRKL